MAAKKTFLENPALNFITARREAAPAAGVPEPTQSENELVTTVAPYEESLDAIDMEPSEGTLPGNAGCKLKKVRRARIKPDRSFDEEMSIALIAEREARIPGAIILDARLSYSDYKLFSALSLYKDYRTGVCWPSYSELNKKFGFPVSSIKASINKLIELGYISREVIAGKRRVYTLYPFNKKDEKSTEKNEE